MKPIFAVLIAFSLCLHALAQDKPKSAGGGIQDEKPIAVKSITCSGLLPEGMRLRAVRFFTPEVDEVVELKWKLSGRKITFTVPEFLVYGVVELDY